MIRALEPGRSRADDLVSRKLFVVIEPMCLNGTTSPMKQGQTGFAYVPTADPVELEIDNIGYTVAQSIFNRATKWK